MKHPDRTDNDQHSDRDDDRESVVVDDVLDSHVHGHDRDHDHQLDHDHQPDHDQLALLPLILDALLASLVEVWHIPHLNRIYYHRLDENRHLYLTMVVVNHRYHPHHHLHHPMLLHPLPYQQQEQHLHPCRLDCWQEPPYPVHCLVEHQSDRHCLDHHLWLLRASKLLC